MIDLRTDVAKWFVVHIFFFLGSNWVNKVEKYWSEKANMVILQKTYFQMIQKQFTRCIKGQRGDPPWMRIACAQPSEWLWSTLCNFLTVLDNVCPTCCYLASKDCFYCLTALFSSIFNKTLLYPDQAIFGIFVFCFLVILIHILHVYSQMWTDTFCIGVGGDKLWLR